MSQLPHCECAQTFTLRKKNTCSNEENKEGRLTTDNEEVKEKRRQSRKKGNR